MALRSVRATAGLVQAVAFDVGRKPDGLQHFVSVLISSVSPSLPDGNGDDGSVVGDRLDLGAGADLDAEFLELLLDLLGDLGVLVGQRAGQEFDDGHVDAVVLQHVTELDADGPGSGDNDRLRKLSGQDEFLVGDHVVRQRGTGDQPGAASGRDDDVVECDGLGTAVVELNRQRVGVGELAVSVDLGDLVLLHQKMHTGDPALGHLAASVIGGNAVVGGTSPRR